LEERIVYVACETQGGMTVEYLENLPISELNRKFKIFIKYQKEIKKLENQK